MKTINVKEATEAQVNWLVAECEGLKPTVAVHAIAGTKTAFVFMQSGDYRVGAHFATAPTQAVPIMEREKFEFGWTTAEGWYVNHFWRETDKLPEGKHDGDLRAVGDGPNLLIAAMRCFLNSRLGETAEVPEELA
jgi:hypothetical protein